MMRILISLTLSLTIFSSSAGFAANVAATPTDMLNLVDEYIAENRSTQTGPIHLDVGKQVYLAQAVVGQVIGLTPEDFNMFLFYTIERYIKRPSERGEIFTLLKELRDAIAVDLHNTQMLRDGPGHSIVNGAYRKAAWVLVMYAGFRFAATYLTRGKAFLSIMEQQELALIQRGPYYRLAYRVATNPLVWATAAGGAIGYWDYLRDRNKTQKLDPIEILNVVQANLACDLSYRALEVEDEYEKYSSDPKLLEGVAPRLLRKIDWIGGQAELLKKQFARLQSLEIGERLFNERLQRFPPAKNWQQFRSNLVDAEKLKDGECRAISLDSLNLHFTKLAMILAGYVKPEDLKGRRNNPFEGDPEQVPPPISQPKKLNVQPSAGPRSPYEHDPEQVPPLPAPRSPFEHDPEQNPPQHLMKPALTPKVAPKTQVAPNAQAAPHLPLELQAPLEPQEPSPKFPGFEDDEDEK